MDNLNNKPDLRVLRDSRGWTQQEVADMAGISRTYVAMLETGRVPSVSVAQKLAKVFRIKWFMFFEDEE